MIKLILSTLALLIVNLALANPLLDERYVTEIKSDANGQIMRRDDVRAAFKKIHPCPSTGMTTGACRGWQMNHTVPLACFGADTVSNLSWQPTIVKTCFYDWCQDRFERKIYAIGKGTTSCKNERVIITDPIR